MSSTRMSAPQITSPCRSLMTTTSQKKVFQ